MWNVVWYSENREQQKDLWNFIVLQLKGESGVRKRGEEKLEKWRVKNPCLKKCVQSVIVVFLFVLVFILVIVVIHHFHVDHNAPCLPPPPPPKFCSTIVLDFSWDDCTDPQGKFETMVMQIFFLGGGGGGEQSALWSMWKWWIVVILDIMVVMVMVIYVFIVVVVVILVVLVNYCCVPLVVIYGRWSKTWDMSYFESCEHWKTQGRTRELVPVVGLMEDGQQKTQTGHWKPLCLHTPFSPPHTMSAPCHNCHDVGIVILGIILFHYYLLN